ncbi:Zinc finger (C3HC4-type RING finger) family protein [Rhynchospora pubera]|uniref:Zinc finger (C3HC4-type RING finger) family protein n=1 Tax=Rhynchospora pubera TaxID=906938 RepID=A0AAV8FLM9_9POAL|nr:Zinc finger (C3HC4-type RING finger) family protein [Rhynchospora pubera]
MGGGGGVSRWKKSIKRMGFPPFCASIFSLFYASSSSSSLTKTISCSAVNATADSTQGNKEKQETTILADKTICAICLDPLCSINNTTSSIAKSTKNSKGNSENNGKIFVAECTHSFHFTCIVSNIRHGNLTCPICRAQWTQLPRDLKLPPFLSHLHNSDPILRILDHSITTSRVNRQSSRRTVRYNDDDPIDPTTAGSSAPSYPSLQFSLMPLTNNNPNYFQRTEIVALCQTRAHLSLQLTPQPAMDIVLVVSANGPHIRLLKQSMAVVIFSLRAMDRLAIVTYSTTATRAFPLRRMSAQGKRTALQVIDRISYTGGRSPLEGLQKGAKILEDRTHRNPIARILHLSDGINRSQMSLELGHVQFPIDFYDIGVGFGMPSELLMHEFEDFVSGLLGGVIRGVRLRIGDQIGWLRIGELRGGEERRIPLDLVGDCGYVVVGYSYVEGRGIEEEVRSGEAVVGFEEKDGRSDSDCEERERHLSMTVARRSCGDRWEYLDPLMVRRWAKHLHGYRTAKAREERCLV